MITLKICLPLQVEVNSPVKLDAHGLYNPALRRRATRNRGLQPRMVKPEKSVERRIIVQVLVSQCFKKILASPVGKVGIFLKCCGIKSLC